MPAAEPQRAAAPPVPAAAPLDRAGAEREVTRRILAGRPTRVLLVGVDPPAPEAVTAGAVREAATALVGAHGVAAIGRCDPVLTAVVLGGAEGACRRINDLRTAQTLEVEIGARLQAAGHPQCGVSVVAGSEAVGLEPKVALMVRAMLNTLGDRAAVLARGRAHLQQVASLLEHQRLRILFQPIVHLERRAIVGYEALCRGPVDHPLEMPSRLFEAADQAGLLGGLHWELVWLARLRAGQRFASPDLLLFVNVEPRELGDAPPPRRHDWDRPDLWPEDQIVAEVTERRPIADLTTFRRHTDRYRRRGYRYALDDVGSGYAGLGTLALLAPEFIKVDMHLVQGCEEDPVRQSVVSALVHLARSIGAEVIAEGVETRAQLLMLRRLGVDYGQGFLLACPAEDPPPLTGSGLAALRQAAGHPLRGLRRQA
ncbi:MAG TPA: EAL domain-containing protein [Candidatus Micrarchaeia archaeon]|nr:EAL domain-containing protein [Candidatus Micrarchaeia archaeon]